MCEVINFCVCLLSFLAAFLSSLHPEMSDLSKQGTEPPVDVGDSTAFVNELPSLRRNTAVGASAIAYSTFVLELIQ